MSYNAQLWFSLRLSALPLVVSCEFFTSESIYWHKLRQGSKFCMNLVHNCTIMIAWVGA